jgi:LysM repeat protein
MGVFPPTAIQLNRTPMSTIRPLATIAVLAVLGVFLARKINDGPPMAMDREWKDDVAITEEPPAWNGGETAAPATTADATLAARSAPSWADSAPAAMETKPEAVAAPAFPAMPAMPGGATATKAPPQPTLPTANNSTTASNQALDLPASIPTAQYGSDATTVTSSTINGRVPSLQSVTPQATTTTVAASASPFPATTSLPQEASPLDTSPVTASAVPQAAPGFAAAWQAVEMALERDELTRAHRMLSQWRAEPNLSPAERQQVEGLLSQLAGSVVYSNEHRLEPAYVVQPGETLATIAEDYNVPWQLLAKINGVTAVDAVQPGQQLKVIRGPFNAEVDLARSEVVLLLDDRYAGRFPVNVEGQAPTTGEWRVGQKRLDAPNQPVVGEGQKVVLEKPTGEQIELSAGPTPPLGARGRLTIASNDLADLYDILSVGSAVTVRR